MPVELPSEILNTIFDLAADEHVIFDPSLPNAMAESTWFTPLPDQWQLRTPQDSLNLIQRRSYATKKVCVLPALCASADLACRRS